MSTAILQSSMTGGAGTKEWLESIEGWTVLAYDLFYRQDVSTKPMLSSSPLTQSDIEIGRKIAQQYGLTE